jgi:hypothetical protein
LPGIALRPVRFADGACNGSAVCRQRRIRVTCVRLRRAFQGDFRKVPFQLIPSSVLWQPLHGLLRVGCHAVKASKKSGAIRYEIFDHSPK